MLETWSKNHVRSSIDQISLLTPISPLSKLGTGSARDQAIDGKHYCYLGKIFNPSFSIHKQTDSFFMILPISFCLIFIFSTNCNMVAFCSLACVSCRIETIALTYPAEIDQNNINSFHKNFFKQLEGRTVTAWKLIERLKNEFYKNKNLQHLTASDRMPDTTLKRKWKSNENGPPAKE